MAADAKDLLIRELKDSVSEQRQMNKTLRAALENSNNQVAELTIQIQLLNEQLEYMKRKLFGRSSEKHAAETDGQLTLFDEPEKEEPAILPAAEIPVKSHVRKPKATFEEKTKNLPVERIEVPLPEEDQFCSVCGTHLEVIGKEVVRKELEYIPATLKVVEYVSIHYGCPQCKQDAEKPNIIHSPVPPSLLGSYASPSTVAWVIYQKYVNGLPLYRQEKDWLQYGFALSRTTMANWVISCAVTYLKVLYDYYHLGEEGSFNFDLKEARKVGADFRNDLCNGMMQFSEGAMGHGGKKVKNAWNIGDYQLAVLYGNGSVFATCVSGL